MNPPAVAVTTIRYEPGASRLEPTSPRNFSVALALPGGLLDRADAGPALGPLRAGGQPLHLEAHGGGPVDRPADRRAELDLRLRPADLARLRARANLRGAIFSLLSFTRVGWPAGGRGCGDGLTIGRRSSRLAGVGRAVWASASVGRCDHRRLGHHGRGRGELLAHGRDPVAGGDGHPEAAALVGGPERVGGGGGSGDVRPRTVRRRRSAATGTTWRSCRCRSRCPRVAVSVTPGRRRLRSTAPPCRAGSLRREHRVAVRGDGLPARLRAGVGRAFGGAGDRHLQWRPRRATCTLPSLM